MTKNFSPFFFLISLFFFLGISIVPAEETEQKLDEMTFENDVHAWNAERYCKAFLEDGVLRVEAVGGTPILSRLVDRIGGNFEVVAEIRTLAESSVNAYWTTRGSPSRSNEKMLSRPMNADGRWHEYRFQLPVPDYLTSISFRFTANEGVWDIRKISVFRRRAHPLSVAGVSVQDYKAPDGNTYPRLRYTIRNDAPVSIKFRVDGQDGQYSISGNGKLDLLAPLKAEENLASASVKLLTDEFPPIAFPVFRYDDRSDNGGKTDWITKTLGNDAVSKNMALQSTALRDAVLEIAPDARMARFKKGEIVVAVIAPIVHRQGIIPKFSKISETENELAFDSGDTRLEIRIDNGIVRLVIESKDDNSDADMLEGPVVRLWGTLRSGLLPGVEFLGPGDVSSSAIDIEEPNNRRSTPPRTWITMPLAVLGTDRGALMLRWNDMTLQPTFASPNGFDHTDDHRMSLIAGTSRKIEATLEFLESLSDDEPAALQALRRYIQSTEFPEPPPAPRGSDEQYRLSLRAMQGPLRSEDGLQWGYAIEPDWPRKSYADMLSTTSRLLDIVNDARIPKPGSIVPGGADIANDAIYFLTGQVEQWRSSREEAIRSILAIRNPDGSFLHRTRFPEVESASASFGHTAVRTLEIMEFVRLTGSGELFQLVRSSLDYLKNCKLPRGGFYRGDPLHTPDLLTAATLTWLYVWAFEFSGEKEYLELAKRFAYAGLPFVYQWETSKNSSGEPQSVTAEPMLYVTVPKLGGTGRRPPIWFGASQPRIGLVYGYALQLLARHDTSVDWKRVATGILHAAESMQFTDGRAAGCLPEVYDVASRERRSWLVNPCALTSLRLALEGRPDSLCLFLDERDRYVSPYPLRRTPKGIEAYDVPEGRPFQVLRSGNRILSLTGPGLVYRE